MVYQWKVPLNMGDAQTAGEEFERIYNETGKIEPKEVVNRSREETAPLHPCFEWDDVTAAEKYRENQAEKMIRNIVTVAVPPTQQKEPQIVRAFVNVNRTYQPMRIVMQDEEKMNELLSTAIRDLRAFQSKYRVLESLRPVMSAIDQAVAQLKIEEGM